MQHITYMQDADNQQIVEDVENIYREVILNIPEKEMANINIEVSAETFCCMAELLMALLATYEGYGDCQEELDEIYETVH